MTQEEPRQRNNVTIFGRRNPTIIFAQGYGCDQNMWRLMIPHFTKDYKVFLFDHVRSGNSDEATYSYENYNFLGSYTDDLLKLCEAFKLKSSIL